MTSETGKNKGTPRRGRPNSSKQFHTEPVYNEQIDLHKLAQALIALARYQQQQGKEAKRPNDED